MLMKRKNDVSALGINDHINSVAKGYLIIERIFNLFMLLLNLCSMYICTTTMNSFCFCTDKKDLSHKKIHNIRSNWC